MKKILALLVCLMMTNLIATAQVEKYKSFQTKSFNPLTDNLPSTWNEAKILLVLNLDKSKIHIYAKKETDLDIVNAWQDHTDEKGNIWLKYKCIDQDGLRCDVEWEIFKDQSGIHTGTLFLEYQDWWVIFRLMSD